MMRLRRLQYLAAASQYLRLPGTTAAPAAGQCAALADDQGCADSACLGAELTNQLQAQLRFGSTATGGTLTLTLNPTTAGSAVHAIFPTYAVVSFSVAAACTSTPTASSSSHVTSAAAATQHAASATGSTSAPAATGYVEGVEAEAARRNHFKRTVVIPVAVICSLIFVALVGLCFACCIFSRRRRNADAPHTVWAAGAASGFKKKLSSRDNQRHGEKVDGGEFYGPHKNANAPSRDPYSADAPLNGRGQGDGMTAATSDGVGGHTVSSNGLASTMAAGALPILTTTAGYYSHGIDHSGQCRASIDRSRNSTSPSRASQVSNAHQEMTDKSASASGYTAAGTTLPSTTKSTANDSHMDERTSSISTRSGASTASASPAQYTRFGSDSGYRPTHAATNNLSVPSVSLGEVSQSHEIGPELPTLQEGSQEDLSEPLSPSVRRSSTASSVITGSLNNADYASSHTGNGSITDATSESGSKTRSSSDSGSTDSRPDHGFGLFDDDPDRSTRKRSSQSADGRMSTKFLSRLDHKRRRNSGGTQDRPGSGRGSDGRTLYAGAISNGGSARSGAASADGASGLKSSDSGSGPASIGGASYDRRSGRMTSTGSGSGSILVSNDQTGHLRQREASSSTVRHAAHAFASTSTHASEESASSAYGSQAASMIRESIPRMGQDLYRSSSTRSAGRLSWDGGSADRSARTESYTDASRLNFGRSAHARGSRTGYGHERRVDTGSSLRGASRPTGQRSTSYGGTSYRHSGAAMQRSNGAGVQVGSATRSRSATGRPDTWSGDWGFGLTGGGPPPWIMLDTNADGSGTKGQLKRSEDAGSDPSAMNELAQSLHALEGGAAGSGTTSSWTSTAANTGTSETSAGLQLERSEHTECLSSDAGDLAQVHRVLDEGGAGSRLASAWAPIGARASSGSATDLPQPVVPLSRDDMTSADGVGAPREVLLS